MRASEVCVNELLIHHPNEVFYKIISIQKVVRIGLLDFANTVGCDQYNRNIRIVSILLLWYY